jgi:hypothetical protein
MLIRQGEQVEALQRELKETKARLAQREIDIENAGSLAEAALRLSGIFEAADQAAALYLDNVHRLGEDDIL